MATDKALDRAGDAMLSIGALSKATGIPVETLRTWERRYGYPVPERKPSGHRLYALASVPRLRRIAEALARGHRAGEVVGADDRELEALLRASGTGAGAGRHDVPADDGVSRLLHAVVGFDAGTLTRLLLADYARLGPLDFMDLRLAPLVRAVGDGWAEGRLEIRHEHFISERIGDLLRSLRLPYEERAAGPCMLLATLPGEMHALGLQMAAFALVTAGLRVLYLGTEVPVPEIAAVARERGVRATGVSVSVATRGAGTDDRIRTLRQLLPRRIPLVIGGEGAPDAEPGLTIIHDVIELDAWARRLREAS